MDRIQVRERMKFRRCLFTLCIKREIRHFHIAVVQKRQRNAQKSVIHVQRCCFAYQTYCFFLAFSLPSCLWIFPNVSSETSDVLT